MPDQFGNPTPQEAMQAIIVQREASIQNSRTPAERRLNSLFFMGQAMGQGMDPRVSKAAAIQDAMGRSNTLQRIEGESNLDYQIRQGRIAMEDVRDVDAATFAQINEQVTQLEAERLDRELLLSRESRDTARFEQEQIENTRQNSQDAIEDGLNSTVRFLDPSTGQITDDVVFTDDPGWLAQQRALEQRGLVPVLRDEVQGILDTRAGDSKVWNRSDFAKQRESIRAAAAFANTGNTLAGIFNEALDEGWNPASSWAPLERKLLGAFNTIQEGARAVGVDLPDFGSEEYQADVSRAQSYLREQGVTSGVTASLLTGLAYSLARTYDNRVTDADLRYALDMLGGETGDPAVILGNLSTLVEDRYGFMDQMVRPELQTVLEHAPIGSEAYIQGNILNDQLNEYSSINEEFKGSVSRVQDRLLPQPKEETTSRGRTSIPGVGDNLTVSVE